MPPTTQDLITELFVFGLRAEDIAARTGATVMSVYRWKSGDVKPHRGYAAAVARLWKYEKGKREPK